MDENRLDENRLDENRLEENRLEENLAHDRNDGIQNKYDLFVNTEIINRQIDATRILWSCFYDVIFHGSIVWISGYRY